MGLVQQQQQQQQEAAAAADIWPAVEATRRHAAEAAEGVLQLAALFADLIAAPLAAAAAASGAADAAAICGVQTLQGFTQLIILILRASVNPKP